MPHNLYLHSSIVQTRKFEQTPDGRREAIKFATIDSTFALMFALFINAAILILSAAVFHWSAIRMSRRFRRPTSSSVHCWPRRCEHSFCRCAACIGAKLDPYRHTGWPNRDGRFSQYPDHTVAAAFDHTAHCYRAALLVIGFFGESKTTDLLVASQVVLSMQLGFAVWPLMRFTNEKAKMASSQIAYGLKFSDGRSHR